MSDWNKYGAYRPTGDKWVDSWNMGLRTTKAFWNSLNPFVRSPMMGVLLTWAAYRVYQRRRTIESDRQSRINLARNHYEKEKFFNQRERAAVQWAEEQEFKPERERRVRERYNEQLRRRHE
eukprot:TRINITY_DN2501_c0_g1_i1.p1 TRINITY_DN2501_c0_g1~~TRINITY_DN2501_c0_g1_i1.p1  ORF type:complete len:121 (+),score=22.86 TRINITY_DN2501_c0_g1_i1:120-482(+)